MRIFDVNKLEDDIRETVQQRPAAQLKPLPDYVQHREGITEIGRLSAEAIVREQEGIEAKLKAAGLELRNAAVRCEEMVLQMKQRIVQIDEVIEKYQAETKRVFEQIEIHSAVMEDAGKTCDDLIRKIAST